MKEQKSSDFKEIVKEAFSLKDTATHSEIRSRLEDAGKVTGTNMCMMACANIIACIGLNVGSMTTCIGAMLLEPLMGSILMIDYCMVSADREGFKEYGMGFLFQTAACLIASTLYFIITPVKDPTDELLSFTQPTMAEVMVAFFGGIAAVIGMTRKDRFNTIIPGVAIATALMLPLCTCGYSIATLDHKMLMGTLYNFIVNVYFISLGAVIVLNLLRIPRDESMTDKEWARGRRMMMINTLIIIIPAVLFSLYKLFH